ncbi:NAD(P)-dependent oxidoreductase [Nicoliella spurrieriana]|uniref:NAD(P)-dependent oxidoreductase n=1 Tax=Nicoliella spurrieriana TaxID=2925830 RepID=UPI0021A594F6|nr:NAD(P)-dependent oxidoreductase [Nicoliella spurrieriana]
MGHPATGFTETVSTNDLADARITNAEIVVNALPLTAATRGMYNQAFFDRLTHQPIFITIGRGPSTNTDDLLAAIDNGKLGAAGLDVTDPEPLPADHPLWQRENVLITSHISGIHAEYLDESIAIFNQNLSQFNVNGQVAINQVDFKKGY